MGNLPAGITHDLVKKAFAQLLRIRSRWCEGTADYDTCLREFYDVFARLLKIEAHEALTKKILVDYIPSLVFMLAGMDQMFASTVPEDLEDRVTAFLELYETEPAFQRDMLTRLRGRISFWQAEELESTDPGRHGGVASVSEATEAAGDVAGTQSTQTESKLSADVKSERHALRDGYRMECRLRGIRVTDAMIAEAASSNWHGRTAIQKWLGCDHRYDGEPDRLIRSVFVKKPHVPSKP